MFIQSVNIFAKLVLFFFFFFSISLVFVQLSHVTPSSVHKAASFSTPELKAKTVVDEGKGKEIDEIRTQIKELLLSVELLKTQQT